MPATSLDPLLLSADEPTSPKKPKSVPEPESSDVEGGAPSPLPSEWTSVRISPGEDVVGPDVLAVCVLVTSDDSRYAQATAGRAQKGLGKGSSGRELVFCPLTCSTTSLWPHFLICGVGTVIAPVSQGTVRSKT